MIAGAMLMDISSDFGKKLDKNKPTFVYCASGFVVKRAQIR
jgi:rhodanese-related sulfurtransferase